MTYQVLPDDYMEADKLFKRIKELEIEIEKCKARLAEITKPAQN